MVLARVRVAILNHYFSNCMHTANGVFWLSLICLSKRSFAHWCASGAQIAARPSRAIRIFAIPHKHCTRQTIEGLCRAYVENDQKTYEDAVMTDDGVPERAVSGRMLAASSIHRWIGTLAELIRADQDALKKLLQEILAVQLCRHFGPIQIAEKKYKTSNRRQCLLRCRWFFKIQAVFKKSAFTEFVITSV